MLIKSSSQRLPITCEKLYTQFSYSCTDGYMYIYTSELAGLYAIVLTTVDKKYTCESKRQNRKTVECSDASDYSYMCFCEKPRSCA